MKSLCVADANSLVYLRDIRLGRRYVLTLLSKHFDLITSYKVSSEVNRVCERLGITVHRLDALCKVARRRIYYRNDFESALRRCHPNVDHLDPGERDNCCLALQEAVKTKRLVVFLTDDRRARRGSLDSIFQTILLGVVWSSQDLLLHLFFHYSRSTSIAEVEKAMRDVTARIAGTPGTDPMPEKWVSELIKYVKRLRKVEQAFHYMS